MLRLFPGVRSSRLSRPLSVRFRHLVQVFPRTPHPLASRSSPLLVRPPHGSLSLTVCPFRQRSRPRRGRKRRRLGRGRESCIPPPETQFARVVCTLHSPSRRFRGGSGQDVPPRDSIRCYSTDPSFNRRDRARHLAHRVLSSFPTFPNVTHLFVSGSISV